MESGNTQLKCQENIVFSFDLATEKIMSTSASFRPYMISSHDRLFTTSGWFLQM